MLVDIVEGIPERLRSRIAALWIEPDGRGGWQVRISYSQMVSPYPGEQAAAGPYAICADLDDLPAGVEARARTRYPDSVHALDVWGENPAPHLAHQIRALEDSALLGGLDAHDHGGRWLIKTHAGSDAERAAWIRSLAGGAP